MNRRQIDETCLLYAPRNLRLFHREEDEAPSTTGTQPHSAFSSKSGRFTNRLLAIFRSTRCVHPFQQLPCWHFFTVTRLARRERQGTRARAVRPVHGVIVPQILPRREDPRMQVSCLVSSQLWRDVVQNVQDVVILFPGLLG